MLFVIQMHLRANQTANTYTMLQLNGTEVAAGSETGDTYTVVDAHGTSEGPTANTSLQGNSADVGAGIASDGTNGQVDLSARTTETLKYLSLLGDDLGVYGPYENDNPYESVDDG